MIKKAHIIVRLILEARNVDNASIKAEIEKEISKAIFLMPWADRLEAIEIEETPD